MCQSKKFFLNGLLIAICIFISVGWVERTQSQDKYPTRAIDIIVPWAPGGSTDLTSRVMADYLKKKWGVPVNIINKIGGAGVPASLEVIYAEPNGYTLFADNGAASSSLEIAIKDLPFKVLDRTFICAHSYLPFAFAVPSASPFKTFKDAVDDAKKDPEHFTWTSLGGGAQQDVGMRQLCKVSGIDFPKSKPVVAAGGSQAVVLLAGSHVKFGGGTPISLLPAFKAGTIRVLAVTSEKRWPDIPDVPTTSELGYPTITAQQWNGVSGPPKLPSYIVAVWEKAVQEMTKDPDIISKMKNMGSAIRYLNSRELREYIMRETEEFKKLWGIN